MYLDYHHMGLRHGAAFYFVHKWFSGLFFGKWSSQKVIDEYLSKFKDGLSLIEKVWLKKDRGYKFMFSDQPSIADLSFACELGELEFCDFEGVDLKTKHPEIYSWFYDSMMGIP